MPWIQVLHPLCFTSVFSQQGAYLFIFLSASSDEHPFCHFDEVYRISVFFHGYCFLCPVLETFAYAHVLDFPHMSGFNWFAPLSSARATFLSSTHLGSPPQYQALVPIPARQRQHKSGLWTLRLSLAQFQHRNFEMTKQRRRLVKTQSCLDSVSN